MSSRGATLCLTILAVALAATGCAGPLAGRGLEDGRDLGRPGEEAVELTFDGAWSWLSGPHAVSHAGEHERTYVAWVNAVGDLRVASYDHETRRRLLSVVREEFQTDDGANPALIVLPDGRIEVFYSGVRGRWLASRASVRPEDVSEWSRDAAVGQYAGGSHGYSHPNVARLSSEGGTYYVFWRGEGYRPWFATSTDGVAWSEPREFVACDTEEPYLRMSSDGDATMHFVLTDGHPHGRPTNSVYYVCYSDGAFRRADGSFVAGKDDLPLALSDLDLVYDARESRVPAWLWDVAADEEGRPVIVYANFPSKTDHRYRYAAWDGSAWVDSEITEAGSWFPKTPEDRQEDQPFYSGGLALDPTDPRFVYLSKPVDGVFEIERWRTGDHGRSWTSEAVTSGSAADNVRPCVPTGRLEGGPEVLWMHGSYINSRSFETSIRLR